MSNVEKEQEKSANLDSELNETEEDKSSDSKFHTQSLTTTSTLNKIRKESLLRSIEKIIFHDTIEALNKNQIPQINFPNSTKKSTIKILSQSRKVASIYLILQFSYNLLSSNRTATTREVYYFHVTHFNNQRECDAAIFDTASLLGVSRIHLGISASPKGWYCGCIIVETKKCANEESSSTFQKVQIDGTCPPSLIQGIPITREWIDACNSTSSENSPLKIISSLAKFILVIEKEGIYTRLSEDQFYLKLPCILVTGRGFPDIATRAFVYELYSKLKIPVLGLCDCNPYGISVLKTFVKGSETIGIDQLKYSVPLIYLGLCVSQILEILKGNYDNYNGRALPKGVFQKLTAHDRKRIRLLIQQQKRMRYSSDDNRFVGLNHTRRNNEDKSSLDLSSPNDFLIDELELQLRNGYKLELEALHWLGMDFFSSWLLDKILNLNL